MNKKLLPYILVIVLVGIAGYYIYNKEAKITDNNVEVGKITNPFENISIPEGKDEATRAVMQVKIDNTKAMYDEKPDIWETWIAIGNLKVVLEDYEGAVDAYRQSIVLQDNNILGYRNIAEVYKNNLKDYVSAKEYYRLALELAPGDPEIYIALALVEEYQLKDLLSAEETYLNGLRNTNDNFEILNRLLLFYNRNNPEKSKDVQDKINELYP